MRRFFVSILLCNNFKQRVLRHLLHRNNSATNNNHGWSNNHRWADYHRWADNHTGSIPDNHLFICSVNTTTKHHLGANYVSSYYVRAYVITSNNYNNPRTCSLCYVNP